MFSWLCLNPPHTHTHPPPPTPPAPDCSQSGSCSETPPLCLLSQAYLPAFSLSLYSCSLSLCFLTSRLPSCEGPSPRISQFVFEIVLHYGILSMRSEKSLSKCCHVCVFAHFLLIVCVCLYLTHAGCPPIKWIPTHTSHPAKALLLPLLIIL